MSNPALSPLMNGVFAAKLSHAEIETKMGAASYEAQCQESLVNLTDAFKQLESNTGPKTIDSVLTPFNELEIALGNSVREAGLYSGTHPDETMRELAKQQRQNLIQLKSEIYMSAPIYAALQALDTPNDTETARFLEELICDYQRSGVDLPEEKRELIKQKTDDVTRIGQIFNDNINSDVRFIELDSVDELDGLPEDYIAAHPANEEGKIRITTNYPDSLPFMRYATNDQRRLEMATVSGQRGYPANVEILKDILKTRHELAQLLGHPNHAESIADIRMIKTADNIQAFIDKLDSIARPHAEKDYAELLARAQQMDPTATSVDAWSANYLSDLVCNEKYDVDAKEVRSYFRYGNVRDGILALTSKLFNVTYRRWDTPVWHKDVIAYEMLENGEVIGRFFFDMHPREDKFKHAAHFPILLGIDGVQLPTSALVCNFPGAGDDDALMEHSQVITFLHEFGHLTHHLFGGNQRWARFSGVATEFDFVEAPSQMLEEWVWSREAMDMISSNANNEPIPDDLLMKLKRSKEFGRGLFVTSQLRLAATSLLLYNRDPENLDPKEIEDQQRDKFSPFTPVPNTFHYTSFGHLNGYSAGYYTYQWSLVISKDLFSRFDAEGPMNTQTADEYRRKILNPGGSKEATELVEDFLGRPYSFEPFEKWLNSATTPTESSPAE